MPDTFDYTALEATAKRLIERFGRSISFFKESETAADSDAPFDGPAPFDSDTAPAEQKIENVKAVFVGAGDTKFQDELGGLIRHGSAGFLIYGSVSSELENFDVVVDGSDLWKIDNVEPLKPGDTNVIYGVEVSR